MYEIGQKVLYGVNGVCIISEVTTKNIGGDEVEYYVLQPVFSNVSKLFVPTKSELLMSKMRPVLSKAEAQSVLDSLPESEPWNNNKNERLEHFKSVIAKAESRELVALIKIIRDHEALQAKKGRRLHIADERILKEAERMVFDEFALALDIDRGSVLSLILK